MNGRKKMPKTLNGNYISEAAKNFSQADKFWLKGKHDKARTSYKKSIDLYMRETDIEGRASALNRLGELELSLHEYDGAKMLFSTACTLVKGLPEYQTLYANIVFNKAKLATETNDYKHGLKRVKQAEDIVKATKNNVLWGDILELKSYIYQQQGNEKEALDAMVIASNLYKDARNSIKEASVLRSMARILIKNKDYDTAHDLLERCKILYRENGDLLGEASVLTAIGSLRLKIGDIEKSRKALMKSVALYDKATHAKAKAETLLYLARVEASDKIHGDFHRAKIHYKKAIEIFNFLGNDSLKEKAIDEYYKFNKNNVIN